MSKQALIDNAWQARLLDFRPDMPPPARIPPLRPEPRPARVIPVTLATISSSPLAQALLAALAGFCAAAALHGLSLRPDRVEADIDWESGLA